jgi:hypothetical protein
MVAYGEILDQRLDEYCALDRAIANQDALILRGLEELCRDRVNSTDGQQLRRVLINHKEMCERRATLVERMLGGEPF